LTIKDGIEAMLEDLSEDAAANPTPEQTNRPVIAGSRGIVLVAGRNELDEAAASLLVHLLRSEPAFDALPAEALTSDRYRSALENATVICLSLVSTHSPGERVISRGDFLGALRARGF
jgi:hypothetical protein